jgi:hypothetical protein
VKYTNYLTERRKTMLGFLANDEPTPVLGRLERSLLYGTGSKLIQIAADVADRLLSLVYKVLDKRNGTDEPDVQEDG